MSRRDDYDHPSPSHTGLIVGMCIAGTVLVLFLAGMAAILAFGGKKTSGTSTPVTTVAPAKMTREEFRSKVKVGMTQEQVIATVGKPNKTSDGGGTIYWYYDDRTVDPVSGKADAHAQVVFVDGKVQSVNF
jgi:outer membrane protein assembly factor BamE (lipoprotein component of BamABCDE complex)